MKIEHCLLALMSLLLFSCKTERVEPNLTSSIPFQKSIGGSEDDLANSVIIENNALYILGQTKSSDDINGDHYLIKSDLAGNVAFEKTYGGSLTEEGIKIFATKDGHFILLGSTESYGNGRKDIHILKVNEGGVVLWENSLGGPLDDSPIDIIETNNGEFCIAGTTESFGAGSRDIYLLWVDQNGNLIRQKTYGGTDIDGSSGIVEIENNELMLYGYTRNFGATSRDLYLLKLSSKGDSLWSKRYGGNGYEESQGFARTNRGGYLLNGHSSSVDPNHNMYVIEVDAKGDKVWENHYGGSLHDGGQTLLINDAGNYVFVARSMSFGNGDRDIYIVVTNPGGDVISEEVIAGAKDDWGQDIISHEAFYYIVGHSNSFSDGDNDVFIVKLRQ